MSKIDLGKDKDPFAPTVVRAKPISSSSRDISDRTHAVRSEVREWAQHPDAPRAQRAKRTARLFEALQNLGPQLVAPEPPSFVEARRSCINELLALKRNGRLNIDDPILPTDGLDRVVALDVAGFNEPQDPSTSDQVFAQVVKILSKMYGSEKMNFLNDTRVTKIIETLEKFDGEQLRNSLMKLIHSFDSNPLNSKSQ